MHIAQPWPTALSQPRACMEKCHTQSLVNDGINSALTDLIYI